MSDAKKPPKKGGNYIPPGSYTPETLPPLSDEAKKILEQVYVDADAAVTSRRNEMPTDDADTFEILRNTERKQPPLMRDTEHSQRLSPTPLAIIPPHYKAELKIKFFSGGKFAFSDGIGRKL